MKVSPPKPRLKILIALLLALSGACVAAQSAHQPAVGAGLFNDTQSPELALAEASDTRRSLQWVISALLILQTGLIIGLQKSRIRYKHTKDDLSRTQKDLEQRIIERTQKLRTLNNQLYEEIAKHEVTEELLRETQDYLHSIINSMPSVLIGLTREGHITHWNTAAEHTTDTLAAAALGRHIHEVYPALAVDAAKIRQAVDSGQVQLTENIQHGSGSQASYSDLTVYPLVSAAVSGAVIRIDDVSMRVRVENMMIQNEKMMSLGELAAGMAHEINNPLSAILHGVQNIDRRTAPGLAANHRIAEQLELDLTRVQDYLRQREVFKFIDDIRVAGQRAASIVSNMLEFSRSSGRRHSHVDLIELLEHSLDLAQNTFELDTPVGVAPLAIITEFDRTLPPVPCSAAEIQQVLLNLLRNASQAFTRSEQNPNPTACPTLTIRAQAEADCICIQVEDNGPGMEQDISRHIFEPFYSTKDVGKGTGLGLSVSYFIVTEHHSGTIEVESEPGKGTVFTVKLPLQQAQIQTAD